MKTLPLSMRTAGLVALSICFGTANAQDRVAPSRPLPTPTDISSPLQALVAKPPPADFDQWPNTPQGWAERQRTSEASGTKTAIAMAARLHVTVKPAVMGGVRVFDVMPSDLAPANRDRLLLHVHAGCYVVGGGEASTVEAILMAAFGHYRVIAIDYRMPPAAYFPAALDDVVAVWKDALKNHKPSQMAMFGTSAGAALALAAMFRARDQGIPLPGALGLGAPMADLTGVGDSFATNAMIDNVLVSRDGFCEPAARFYANGHDVADPLLSPIYGNLAGLPPAILTSGTRDLLLSSTVRLHRKLRQSGVDAQLQVFEAMSHAQYLRDDAMPETREVFEEIASFFDRHLSK
ncbi:alpha/beta hydrolase fold domain-containing protein [Rhodopseudomonas sp. B29]|uniref:alpha/beta hydrolase fold domain-containing protein n=1 Tax=Rhodopseudomonas sp. B29 TaxID=95607 RepID=UPI0005929A69|nr:alpha/beta hydrolase fold domain-containing protein [Rhodopseudomonas sp. B29]